MSPNLSLHALWGANLRRVLQSPAEWKPYPRGNERELWGAIPPVMRSARIRAAESALAAPWPHVPASVYLQFSQNGNRTNYEDLYFGRRKILCDLALGECIEGKGRFLPAVVDALWSICEESSWCLPAHIAAQRAGIGLPDTTDPVLDLFASETGALLAWTAYLLGEQLGQISPLLLPRIHREVGMRVQAPGLGHNDLMWMGFTERPVNNWNPWINSNWLACVLLLEEDEALRLAAVDKILRSLDIFLADYPQDGGCDEGPNYWGRAGASLFDCLELLYSVSGGKLSVYADPLVRSMGQYIYRAHIAGDYYLNFADASAVVRPDPILVLNYGERIGDERMASFGAWLARRSGMLNEDSLLLGSEWTSSPGRELPTLFGAARVAEMPAQAPLLRDVWLSGIQVMASRNAEGSEGGLFLAAKGGHNAESHNHNDVGHFIVYKNGEPLIIDAGVEAYTRKTFSPQRYEIWTMQSAYHSLPTIDGWQQAPGKEFNAREVAHDVSDQAVEFSLNLAKAYPMEAGVAKWVRSLRLERGSAVHLNDSFILRRQPESLTLSLMTVCAVDLSELGLVRLGKRELPDGRFAGSGGIHYSSAQFVVKLEEVAVTDKRMRPVWGDRVFRLIFAVREPAQSGSWALIIQ